MNTIDNNSGEFNFPNTLTFTADIWMPTFSDKEEVRKKRIEKILRSLNDKVGK